MAGPELVVAAESQPQAAVAQDKTIPYKDTRPASGASYMRVVVVFIFVMACVAGVAYAMARSPLRKKLSVLQGKRIRVIETKRLFPKVQVSLVAVDDKEYVLAQSGDGVAFVEHGIADEKTEAKNKEQEQV